MADYDRESFDYYLTDVSPQLLYTSFFLKQADPNWNQYHASFKEIFNILLKLKIVIYPLAC